VEFESDSVLLDLLRREGYTEVKEGCREGECGSCQVLIDGKLMNSCRIFSASVINSEITTVKGLGSVDEPHPLQQAFVDAGAVQCGYCTPGMILSSYSLLRKNPHPDEEEIKRALDGNLCRCTGYVKIIDAVKIASERMAEDE
jgi:carbon-monoxide dehydrogenase small subunit